MSRPPPPPPPRRRYSTLLARVTRLTLHSPSSSSSLVLFAPSFLFPTPISLPLIFPLSRENCRLALLACLAFLFFVLYFFFLSLSPFFLSFDEIRFGRVYV